MYDGIFIYPLLTTALFYLFARATITQWLWSRSPAWLSAMTQCAACAGFWYGGICAAVGIYGFDKPFLGRSDWWVIIDAGLASIVWTPIIAALHEFSMRALGHARIPFTVMIEKRDGVGDQDHDG